MLMTEFSKMTLPYTYDDETPQARIWIYFHGQVEDGRQLGDVVKEFMSDAYFADMHVFAIDAALSVAAYFARTPEAPTKELRFTPSPERFARWTKAAKAAGISITAWVQLAADGLLVRPEEPRETTTAPVQETTQERKPLVRPKHGWLRERIAAKVGDQLIGKSEVPALAESFGVSRQKVFASLNSAVNSKRAIFDGTVYQFVKE